MFSLSVLNSNVMERFLFMAFRKIWEQKDAMKCFFFAILAVYLLENSIF